MTTTTSAVAATASSSIPRTHNIFRDNLFRDLRFAVHYMYANHSEVTGNVSIGNHLGYAVMFSSDVKVTGQCLDR